MGLASLFYPEEKISGLEIGEDRIRFLFLNKSGMVFYIILQESIKLEEGVIENGKIKNKEKLIKTLKTLWQKVEPKVKSSYVILTIPSANIYSQVFKFPNLPSNEIASALELGLGLSLPLPLNEINYNWQEIKPLVKTNKEIILSLIKKDIINPYIEAVKEAGFIPFALEFTALSLNFICNNFKDKSGIIVKIDERGTDLIAIREGGLRFHRFINWKTYLLSQEEKKKERLEISLESIEDILEKEILKIINFYESEYELENNSKIEEVVLLAPKKWKNGLAKYLLTKFNLKILELEPTNKINLKDLKKIDDSWWPVFGAAARGTLPRSEDLFISLLPVGTKETYAQRKLITYLSLLSKIFITTFVAFAIIFIGVWFFLSYLGKNLDKQITTLGQTQTLPELDELEDKAIKFNKDIALILKAQKNIIDQTPILQEITNQLTPGINITQLSMASPADPINLTVFATTRDAALLFKKKIEDNPHFTEVNIPITSLTQSQNIVFTISFKLKVNYE